MSKAYDPSLLASAPKATSAMKQGGYDPQLLQDPVSTRSADNLSGKEYPPYPSSAAHDRAAGLPSSNPNTPQRKPAFWRTRNGIILLVLLGIVVLAAIIGGAVGGSKAHKNGNHAISNPVSGSNSSSSGDSGAHGSPTATTVSVITSVESFGDKTVTQVISSTIVEFAPASTTTSGTDSDSDTNTQTQGFSGAGGEQGQGATTTGDGLSGIVGSQPTGREKGFKRRGWRRVRGAMQ